MLRRRQSQAPGRFTNATVNAYRPDLVAQSLSPSIINIRLSAIRKLALEAADNGLMPPEPAAGTARVKGAKQQGTRTGKWLTPEQAERLISAPNPATGKGRRGRGVWPW